MTLTFDQALQDSEQFRKRHLILGNGFSIACRGDIFHYGSLFAEADFSSCPEARAAFDALGTQDFESVINALQKAAALMAVYGDGSGELPGRLLGHAEALKEILLNTIAAKHPDIPGEITDERFAACRRFLANFLAGDKAGHVFSLNYDLLLYWALMHREADGEEPVLLNHSDGFGNDEDDPDAEYVVWQGETGAHSADVHFLHGALHLFDSGAELKKYTWVRTGTRLIDQARAAMALGYFPVFVAEGTSDQKKNKIRHNAYLYQGLKVLTANAKTGTHCFFIFGHSLAENDDHILKRIGRGKCRKIYVGLYGDPSSKENRDIRQRASALVELRNERNPLDVAFYRAGSANVWG